MDEAWVVHKGHNVTITTTINIIRYKQEMIKIEEHILVKDIMHETNNEREKISLEIAMISNIMITYILMTSKIRTQHDRMSIYTFF